MSHIGGGKKGMGQVTVRDLWAKRHSLKGLVKIQIEKRKGLAMT